MNLVSARRVGLGVASALARPARDVADVGVSVAAAGWRTPLGAPARALVGAAERRGARDEAWLLTEFAQSSSDFFERVLRGPLLDRAIRQVVEARVLERVTAEALEGDALERVLAVAAERQAGVRAADAMLTGDGVERLLTHIVEQPVIDRLIERTLASAALEQRVVAVLDEPALERVFERALASRFAQAATDQILASDELRRIVAHVARSEEVRDALQSQTYGLVDDVGDQVRDRTAHVDDRMEGVARRLLRRRARTSPLVDFDDGTAPA